MKIKVLTVLSLTLVLLLGACGGKSDADLQTAADSALKGDSTTSSVTVEVKDAVATIKGDVVDDAAKAKAEELAKVEGVKNVINEVNVNAPAPAPQAKGDDSEVKTNVEAGLKKVGCANITAEVSDGVATLSGKIEATKMAECVQAANEAGAKRVVNKINL